MITGVDSLQTRFAVDFREIANNNNGTVDECKVEWSIDDFPTDIFTGIKGKISNRFHKPRTINNEGRPHERLINLIFDNLLIQLVNID